MRNTMPIESLLQPNMIYGYATDAGRSGNHNEDSYGVFDVSAVGSANSTAKLLVIADGIGGAVAGERASRLAVDTIQRIAATEIQLEWPLRLEAALQGANRTIFAEAQNEDLAGMGTTVVAAAIEGEHLWIAHVGDSRAYLVRQGIAHLLTVDHTRVQEGIDAGALTLDEAVSHPNRHVITRSLGAARVVEIDQWLAKPEGSQPGLPPLNERRMKDSIQLQPGDRLLLCTDGLHDLVSDIIIQSTVSGHAPDEAARRLIALANGAGGTDNITVVLAAWQVGIAQGMPKLRYRMIVALVLLAVGLLAVLAAFMAPTLVVPAETPAIEVAPTLFVTTARPLTVSPVSTVPIGTAILISPLLVPTGTLTPTVTPAPTANVTAALTSTTPVADVAATPPCVTLIAKDAAALAALPDLMVASEELQFRAGVQNDSTCFTWQWAGELDPDMMAFELLIGPVPESSCGISSLLAAQDIEELRRIIQNENGNYKACFNPSYADAIRTCQNDLRYQWAVAIVCLLDGKVVLNEDRTPVRLQEALPGILRRTSISPDEQSEKSEDSSAVEQPDGSSTRPTR